MLSLRSVYEIGRQVNPALVKGQILGGSVMGLGHALYESTEPYYPNPDHRAGGFFEYILPLAPDVPEMEMRVLEYPSVDGPYGVKGFGEMTANAPIPAIVNAINNALGTDISCHPVTPEVVLRALEALRALERWRPRSKISRELATSNRLTVGE